MCFTVSPHTVDWLAFKGFIVHFSIIPRRRSPAPRASQLSVTLGASFHSRFSCTWVPRGFCSIHCPLVPCLRRNKAQGRFDLLFLDNDLHFLDSHLCDLRFGIGIKASDGLALAANRLDHGRLMMRAIAALVTGSLVGVQTA